MGRDEDGAIGTLGLVTARAGSSALGEQYADCVEDKQRGECQECVEGDLRLSATDLVLRPFHERDDAVCRGSAAALEYAELVQSPATRGAVLISIWFDPADEGKLRRRVSYERTPG